MDFVTRARGSQRDCVIGAFRCNDENKQFLKFDAYRERQRAETETNDRERPKYYAAVRVSKSSAAADNSADGPTGVWGGAYVTAVRFSIESGRKIELIDAP